MKLIVIVTFNTPINDKDFVSNMQFRKNNHWKVLQVQDIHISKFSILHIQHVLEFVF